MAYSLIPHSGLFAYPSQWAIRLSHTAGYSLIPNSLLFAYSTQWAICLFNTVSNLLLYTVGYPPIPHSGLFAYPSQWDTCQFHTVVGYLPINNIINGQLFALLCVEVHSGQWLRHATALWISRRSGTGFLLRWLTPVLNYHHQNCLIYLWYDFVWYMYVQQINNSKLSLYRTPVITSMMHS